MNNVCLCARLCMCIVCASDYMFSYNGMLCMYVSFCVGGSKGKSRDSKSDVSLKRGIHLDVSWDNDPFDLY